MLLSKSKSCIQSIGEPLTKFGLFSGNNILFVERSRSAIVAGNVDCVDGRAMNTGVSGVSQIIVVNELS